LAISIYDQSAHIDPEQQRLGHHRRVNFFNGTANWEKIIHDEVMGRASEPKAEETTSRLLPKAFHEERRQILISGASVHSRLEFDQNAGAN
jgi:hypothetical protein